MKSSGHLPSLIRSSLTGLILIGLFCQAQGSEPDAEKALSLIKQLSDAIESRDRTRVFAVRDSMKALRRRAIPALLEALQDREPTTRLAAVTVIKEFGPQAGDAVPLLIEIAKHESIDAIRIAVIDSLGSVGLERANDVLPALHAGLEDDHHLVRQNAILSLSRFGLLAQDSIPTIFKTINNSGETSNNKALAIGALVSIAPNSKSVLEKLIQLLDDEDSCGHALNALANLGPNATPAVPKIIDLLKDEPFHNINQDAVETLGEIGPSAKTAIPHLILAMNDHNHIVCDSSARALGSIGPVSNRVIPALIRAVRDEKCQCRTAAAEALGQIGPRAKDAVPVLINALGNDKNPYRRRSYIEGLGGIGVGSRQVVAVLTSAIEDKSDEEGYGRRAAARALGQIASNHKDAVAVLARLLAHENAQVRLEAASALAALGQSDQATLGTLIELLKHPDDNGATRENAAKVLGTMGRRAQTAVPDLLIALRQEDAYFRIHVVEALGKIGTGNERIIQALKEILEDEQDEIVRFYAAEALARQGRVDVSVLKELAWHLRNSSHGAARALEKCGPKAKPVLAELDVALKCATSLQFRNAVIQAIKKINE